MILHNCGAVGKNINSEPEGSQVNIHLHYFSWWAVTNEQACPEVWL